MTFEQRPTTANAILCNTFLMDISLTFLHCEAITVMGLCPIHSYISGTEESFFLYEKCIFYNLLLSLENM